MKELKIRDRIITTKNPAFVMGIVNCTPDSFYDKSRGATDYALSLIEQGADLLDLGGESTRPGAQYVSEEEELKRVVPVVQSIRKYSDIPISIDTRRYSVFKACYENGADILNDISALEDDDKLGSYAASVNVPVILMHKRGIPDNMQADYVPYDNVFNQVNDYLQSRVDYAIKCGIREENIILDPGIGFGKSLEDNKILIARCGELLQGRYPVLMALSRKRCIGEMTGKEVSERLYGTLTADIIAVLKGAFMVRVHDVAPAVDTLSVLREFEGII